MRVSWLMVLAPLLLAARPGSEWNLVQQLNGQPVRLIMADGGLSGAFGGATTQACMPLTGLKNASGTTQNANVFMFMSIAGTVNFCIRPSIAFPTWDGGCNTGAAGQNDLNYGTPIAPNVPQYFTPDSRATHFCAVGDAGIQVPVWWVE